MTLPAPASDEKDKREKAIEKINYFLTTRKTGRVVLHYDNGRVAKIEAVEVT